MFCAVQFWFLSNIVSSHQFFVLVLILVVSLPQSQIGELQWQVFEYKRLVQDNNRQVRESAHNAMADLTTNAGCVFLSDLSNSWFDGCSDWFLPCALSQACAMFTTSPVEICVPLLGSGEMVTINLKHNECEGWVLWQWEGSHSWCTCWDRLG
jgi:hypothetical protein